MSKCYMTFGQIHAHNIGGVTVDKDCIAVFNTDEETARQYMWEHKHNEYFTTYPEHKKPDELLHYYPRGYVEVQI